MSDLLGEMTRSSRTRANAALREASLQEWRERATATAPAPALRLDASFDLICEVKFASPSEGKLRGGSVSEAVRRANDYASAGAAAISVLTEPERFGGSLEYLAQIAHAVDVPAMRKDFLVDAVQVCEARVAGAGGVLLITRMLDDAELTELLQMTHALGMFALVEGFDREDLERTARILAAQATPATAAGQTLVGVNSRNLVSLEVEPKRLFDLAADLPGDYPAVAESGLETEDDAAALAQAGYSVALVGTALMRAEDSGALARRLIDAGRARNLNGNPGTERGVAS